MFRPDTFHSSIKQFCFILVVYSISRVKDRRQKDLAFPCISLQKVHIICAFDNKIALRTHPLMAGKTIKLHYKCAKGTALSVFA